DGQQLRFDPRRGRHRARHRLRDVVQLEVQEDPPAARADQLDGPLALGDEQLEADLVEGRPAVQPVQQRRQRRVVRDVQRDDHPLACSQDAHQRRSAFTSSTTIFAASSIFNFRTSPPLRRFSSTIPSATPFLPTASRNVMPIRSASLNFTPARSSRSSYRTSIPAAVRSSYSRLAVASTLSSSCCSSRTATSKGASGSGQTIPSLSWFCSMAAATMRVTPMP